MKNPTRLRPSAVLPDVSEDDGYTVLEGMIAAALLTTVLVVAAGMLTWVSARHGQMDRINALTMAEQVVEQYAAGHTASITVGETTDGRWWIAIDESVRDDVAEVTVRVWRLRPSAAPSGEADAPQYRSTGRRDPPDRYPDVTLMTSRFHHPSSE